MPDLTTTYLGLALKNPLVASASPFSKKLDLVRRLEDAGASAIVTYSLFEEQIDHESYELDYYLDRGTDSYAESLSYFPDLSTYNLGPESYLEHIRRMKQAVAIPVIASLNGVSSGGWLDYACKLEQAGADALELNIYSLPTDPELTSQEIEASYVELVRKMRVVVNIPISLKLTPFFTALPNIAKRCVQAGANGLVLFNRVYQPNFDLDKLEVMPHLELSTARELFLPLRWTALLYGQIDADFALTSGVHSAQDVLKAIMAGASVVMLASSLLTNGIKRLTSLRNEVHQWMEEHDYESITQMKGSMSYRAVANPAAFERANYMKSLNSFDRMLP